MSTNSRTIVLFHSALGLRPSVRGFADSLRALGHVVHTPDLFDGEVFDNLEDGVRKRDALGIAALTGRAQAAVAGLPPGLVYAGFSMGAAAAQFLAGTRPGAVGAILMHAALDPATMGIPAWPRVDVQIHYGTRDPWVDVAAVSALAAAVERSGAPCSIFPYEVEGHLFADEDAPEYNRDAADRMLDRVAEFLRRVPAGAVGS